MNMNSPKNNASSIMNASAFKPMKQQSVSIPLSIMKDKKHSKGIGMLIFILAYFWCKYFILN